LAWRAARSRLHGARYQEPSLVRLSHSSWSGSRFRWPWRTTHRPRRRRGV